LSATVNISCIVSATAVSIFLMDQTNNSIKTWK